MSDGKIADKQELMKVLTDIIRSGEGSVADRVRSISLMGDFNSWKPKTAAEPPTEDISIDWKDKDL